MTTSPSNSGSSVRTSVSGVQLAQGIGVVEAKGFWADSWAQVMSRPRAVFALSWVALVGVLACLAPFIASGHPLILRTVEEGGKVTAVSSPLIDNLSAVDVVLSGGLVAAVVFWFAARRVRAGVRLGAIVLAALYAGAILLAAGVIFDQARTSSDRQTRALVSGAAALWSFRFPVALAVAGLIGAAVYRLTPFTKQAAKLALVIGVGVGAAAAASIWWSKPLQVFAYNDLVRAGAAEARYTLVPFSPGQRDVRGDLLAPGMSAGQTKEQRGEPPLEGRPRHWLGTDSLGQDVLSQLLHACRLSISIGLVSTGLAVMIGVTIGALMGYFGGWVDLLLFRVVEIFMSVPVLFLLIVAAAVLPRDTYVMMTIIGCVTWTGAARFTRAEFMRLRNQDFVQAARALGLPLRSVLFRHILPNGVTPVLVDASFAVAFAILYEATLSFLGLGPEEQASWGRLLADAINTAGDFVWWLAIFPGLAIFITVLSYNMFGEAMRDAIDPKLKKARV